MKGNHEHYSTGPFSRVWFVYDNEGKLDTFTYRHHALQPSGTLVNTISNLAPGVPFHEVFVRTSLVRNPTARSMSS
jgi:hypothetical protein